LFSDLFCELPQSLLVKNWEKSTFLIETIPVMLVMTAIDRILIEIQEQ